MPVRYCGNVKSASFLSKWKKRINVMMRQIQEKVEDLRRDKKERVILTAMHYDQNNYTGTELTPDFRIYRTYLQRYS